MTIRIHEIYPSIQGESSHVGEPCVFIRLTGCPLRCVWCDTTYAFTGGTTMELDDIIANSQAFDLPTVEVTGGEPLAQRETPQLLARLADHFDRVLLETAGSISVAGLDPRVHIILDLKAPGSGEEQSNLWSNLELLGERDEIKIVIADRDDYDWAKEVVTGRTMPAVRALHLSPVHGVLDPKELAAWIIEDRLQVRLQVQQHKYIWSPEARGV